MLKITARAALALFLVLLSAFPAAAWDTQLARLTAANGTIYVTLDQPYATLDIFLANNATANPPPAANATIFGAVPGHEEWWVNLGTITAANATLTSLFTQKLKFVFANMDTNEDVKVRVVGR